MVKERSGLDEEGGCGGAQTSLAPRRRTRWMGSALDRGPWAGVGGRKLGAWFVVGHSNVGTRIHEEARGAWACAVRESVRSCRSITIAAHVTIAHDYALHAHAPLPRPTLPTHHQPHALHFRLLTIPNQRVAPLRLEIDRGSSGLRSQSGREPPRAPASRDYHHHHPPRASARRRPRISQRKPRPAPAPRAMTTRSTSPSSTTSTASSLARLLRETPAASPAFPGLVETALCCFADGGAAGPANVAFAAALGREGAVAPLANVVVRGRTGADAFDFATRTLAVRLLVAICFAKEARARKSRARRGWPRRWRPRQTRPRQRTRPR